MSVLIASLSFAWIALALTQTIPGQHITVYHRVDHRGGLGLNLGHSCSLLFGSLGTLGTLGTLSRRMADQLAEAFLHCSPVGSISE
jgi:hypothetical protein